MVAGFSSACRQGKNSDFLRIYILPTEEWPFYLPGSFLILPHNFRRFPSFSSLHEDMPLGHPSTYGWEPATVYTWAFVAAGDITMVITTASCTEFDSDYAVPILLL